MEQEELNCANTSYPNDKVFIVPRIQFFVFVRVAVAVAAVIVHFCYERLEVEAQVFSLKSILCSVHAG